MIPIYLKYLSAAAASTAAHLLVRRSVAMYWVLLALLHTAQCAMHSTSLRRFVCKECPSASPFNIVPPKPVQEICTHCNVFMWTVYSIASTVGILRHVMTLYQEEGKNCRLGKSNDLIKHRARTALPLVAMPKGEI